MSKSKVAEFAQDRIREGLQTKPSGREEPPTDGDFKSFVLYVYSGAKRTPECFKALEALSRNPTMKLNTLIQDVDSLLSKPTWLSIVPCLVIKDEKRALAGDGAIEYISTLKSKGGTVNYSSQKRTNFHTVKGGAWN